MKPACRKEVDRLVRDPFGFAVLMEKDELESVIVALVSALNETTRR